MRVSVKVKRPDGTTVLAVVDNVPSVDAVADCARKGTRVLKRSPLGEEKRCVLRGAAATALLKKMVS